MNYIYILNSCISGTFVQDSCIMEWKPIRAMKSRTDSKGGESNSAYCLVIS